MVVVTGAESGNTILTSPLKKYYDELVTIEYSKYITTTYSTETMPLLLSSYHSKEDQWKEEQQRYDKYKDGKLWFFDDHNFLGGGADDGYNVGSNGGSGNGSTVVASPLKKYYNEPVTTE